MARRAFTFLEIMVALAISGALGLAIYAFIPDTSSASADSTTRAKLAGANLNTIADAIASLEITNTPTSFLQLIGAYPSRLSQLTTKITTSDLNSCRRSGTDNYSSAAIPSTGVTSPGYIAGWSSPFTTFNFVAGGTVDVATGYTVQDDLVRTPTVPAGNNPSGSALAGTLAIRLPSVTRADALALDAYVDQTLDGTDGTVRYGAGDPVTVDYVLSVSGC